MNSQFLARLTRPIAAMKRIGVEPPFRFSLLLRVIFSENPDPLFGLML
jgi:hypothetical protein